MNVKRHMNRMYGGLTFRDRLNNGVPEEEVMKMLNDLLEKEAIQRKELNERYKERYKNRPLPEGWENDIGAPHLRED